MEITNANQMFREYDGLVGLTMLNIFQASVETQKIRLYHFNRKNTEHLYILRIALMARAVYDFDIEIEGSRWDIFCINWKIRKGFEKVKRYKYNIGVEEEWLYEKGISVPEILNLMRPDGVLRLGESFTFADIYNAYYEGSLN